MIAVLMKSSNYGDVDDLEYAGLSLSFLTYHHNSVDKASKSLFVDYTVSTLMCSFQVNSKF